MLRRSIFANEPMDPSESSHSLHADVPRETEEGLPSETIDAKAGHAVRLAGSQDVTIDPGARELKHRGQLVVLAPPVFDCIAYLLANRERAVGRDELVLLGRRDPVLHAVVDVGLGHPPLQRRLRDIEIDAHLSQDRVWAAGHRDDITLELRREPLGHRNILPETHRVP